MMPLTNHLDHLQIDRTKSHQLNQEILPLLKRLLRWQRRPSNTFIWIFHDHLPYSGIKNQPKRALAL